MPDNAFERQLEFHFQKSSQEDWKKIAMQETQGKDPFKVLAWRGKDEILFFPYYDAESGAQLDPAKEATVPASLQATKKSRTWANLPHVPMQDESTANAQALEHLSLGADGVLFDLRKINAPDFERLLKGIRWPHCFVAINVHANDSVRDALSTYIEKNYDPSSVSGALFWESSPKKSTVGFFLDHCRNLKSLGLIIPNDTPSTEISDALLAGVETFNSVASQSHSEQIFKCISFSVSTDAFLMESIAKIKALRMLWCQVAQAYGLTDYKPGDLHIHTHSKAVSDDQYAPGENMLKGTFSAIAAILGGCDSLTIESEQQPAFVPRWSRNVSSVLREESFFDQADDPLAGAYALDAMVNEIARSAWKKFQSKCKGI